MFGFSRILTPFRLMALAGLLPGLAALALFWTLRPGSVVLQWRFSKDRPFLEESTIQVDERFNIGGLPGTISEPVTLDFQWMPREQDHDRNWIIDRRLQSASSSANPHQALYQNDLYKPFVGTKAKLTVGPHLPGVMIEMPPLAASRGEGDFVTDLQKRLAELVLIWSAPYAVRPGDTWETERELPMSGVGSFLARCRFTYKGLDDTLDRIEMTMEMEYRPPPSGKLTVAASEMSFKSGKLWVEPGAGGTGWFDRHRGRLDHAEIAFHYMGKYTLTINGEDAEVETDAPTRITINIQEFEKPPTKK